MYETRPFGVHKAKVQGHLVCRDTHKTMSFGVYKDIGQNQLVHIKIWDKDIWYILNVGYKVIWNTETYGKRSF